MRKVQSWVRGLLAATGALSAGVSFAGAPGGGVVVYGPDMLARVPTLSEWMLLGLGLMLLVLAYRVLRVRTNGRLLANLTLIGGGALAAAAGHSLFGDARAQPAITEMPLGSSGGGSVALNVDTLYSLVNQTGIAQRILSVTPTSPYSEDDPGIAPRCVVGYLLAPTANCYVRFADRRED